VFRTPFAAGDGITLGGPVFNISSPAIFQYPSTAAGAPDTSPGRWAPAGAIEAPEPTSLTALLAIGSPVLLFRRRRIFFTNN
jgi:hypothetical protein